jgi:hypothetical protein
MRKIFAALLCLSAAATAQEGYPLDGTWRAEHSVGNEHRTVVIIMQWDGKQLSGTINPGPDAVEFTNATLEPEGWKLTINAKDAKGAAINFSGTLSEIGKYHRVLNGEWSEGSAKHALRFVRE